MQHSSRSQPVPRRAPRGARGRALAALGLAALGLAALAGVARAQVTVSVQPLSELLVDLERRAPAEVLPLNDSVLSAEVPAVVSAVHAEVGETVEAGALLVSLEEEDYRLAAAQADASLASARARKAQAETQLARARTLAGDKYLSADELLARETALAVAEADILAAQVTVDVAFRNLDKCRVLAPFTGVVTRRDAQLGAFVVNGSPLLRLVQTDRFELDAQVPAALADTLPAAAAIAFESQQQRWPVRLLRLSPVVESERRARRGRFAFAGEAPEVGRSGELVWTTRRGVLPASLVSRRDAQLGVFLLRDDRAVFHPLPDAQEGRPAGTDLAPETEVIVIGRERLQDGDPVTLR